MKNNRRSVGLLILAAFAIAVLTSCEDEQAGGTPPPSTSMHDNLVVFGLYLTVSSVTYEYNGQYNITGGQPWGGVTTYDSQGNWIVDAKAGRHNSSGPAQWFKSQATNYTCTVCGGGPDEPNDLNFAFNGNIVIEGNSYQAVVGQGSDGVHNNWWIGGNGWNEGRGGVCTPDNKYFIQGWDMSDNEFYVQPGSGAC